MFEKLIAKFPLATPWDAPCLATAQCTLCSLLSAAQVFVTATATAKQPPAIFCTGVCCCKLPWDKFLNANDPLRDAHWTLEGKLVANWMQNVSSPQ